MVETRRIWCDTATAEYARDALTFSGLRVDRHTRTSAGTVTVQTRYFATNLDPSGVSAVEVLRRIRGHWCVENFHYEKGRWWDEGRHTCRRPGLALRFTTPLSAVVSVLQVFKPGARKEPLKARADALNWDIGHAVKLLTG